MTNTYLKLRNFLIISCLLPLSIGNSAIAQQSPMPTLTQPQNLASTNSTLSRFVGQWRLKDYLPIALTVVFTEDGKVFVLFPSYLTSLISLFNPSVAGGGSVNAF